jgi:uncharacterized membrane-anchored protein YjiN (DUF445 family)
MPLPIPIWIAAAVAAAAGYAATRSVGKKPGRHDARPAGEERGAFSRLTVREFFARHLTSFAASADSEPARPAAIRIPGRGWIQYINLCFFPLCALALAAAWVYSSDLARILSISGMIGFGTNWLAITMLFHPRKRHILLGQGLVPKRREAIIEAIADGVSRNLINEEIIRHQLEKSGLVQKITSDFQRELHGLLQDPAFRADLKLLIETYIRDLSQVPEHRERMLCLIRELLDRLELGGVAGRLITVTRPVWKDSALEEIDRWVRRELPGILNKNLDLLDTEIARLPAVLDNERAAIARWLTGTIVYFIKRLDIRKTILEQLRTFDEERVEKLVRNASNDQLGAITLLGGILGIVAGFILWRPIAIVWIAGGGLILAVMDIGLTWLAGIRRRPAST